MSEISTTISVDASPNSVWSILTDFALYGEWNTMLAGAEGVPAVGERLRITIPVGPLKLSFKTTLEQCEPGVALCWTWRLAPLVHVEHYFRLQPAGSGTVMTHGEKFYGWLGWMVPILGGLKPAMYQRLNTALKARAEAD